MRWKWQESHTRTATRIGMHDMQELSCLNNGWITYFKLNIGLKIK